MEAHHVHDRVQGPHLVEVDVFHRLAVGGGLRLGEPTEVRSGPGLHGVGQIEPVHDGEHVGQMAMGMVMVVPVVLPFHPEAPGLQTAPRHLFPEDAQAGDALLQGGPEAVPVDSAGAERAEEHVSRCAGHAFDVEDRHAGSRPSRASSMARRMRWAA